MTLKCTVIVFPGSNCDSDCFHALNDVMRQKAQYAWHKEGSLPKTDLVILPGGFSYGDYLRTGAIARFSPIMSEVARHVEAGKPVIGICNGFQVLLESGLLPGAMLRNKTLNFICKHVDLLVENDKTIFTNKMKKGNTVKVPIAHGEGNYYCDDDTLKMFEDKNRIVFRYATKDGKVTDEINPNGSRNNIAGIINDKGNVLGMMPHPERVSEEILGGEDGRLIWESILEKA